MKGDAANPIVVLAKLRDDGAVGDVPSAAATCAGDEFSGARYAAGNAKPSHFKASLRSMRKFPWS
jgi:hypothetical protein